MRDLSPHGSPDAAPVEPSPADRDGDGGSTVFVDTEIEPTGRLLSTESAFESSTDMKALVDRLLEKWTCAQVGHTTLESSGPPRLDSARAAIPEIPGFDNLGVLGRGGMGVVYGARRRMLNRPCALKLISGGPEVPAELVVRFLAEAEAVARLRHPHVLQIYSIGEHDGALYLELEFAEGGSLAAALDGEPWPPGRAAALLEPLSRAVSEAHRLGIVHRDLKPGNILLMADGTPKVADFGLAKNLNSDSDLTRTDLVVGSPSYMAPEQAEGRSKTVGPAADIYSLGVILYELLAGRPPLRGSSALETLRLVKSIEPVPPSRLVPGLPRDIETICLKCLEKDPARRYPTAAALADDLKRFGDGRPIAARPVGSIERCWRWCRRNRAVAAMAGLFAASLIVGAAASAAFAIRATREAERADGQASLAREMAETARTEAELSEKLRYDAEIHLAYRDHEAGNPGQVRRRLARLAPTAQRPVDHRSFEWHYLRARQDQAFRVFPGADGTIRGLAFSPDGRTISVVGTLRQNRHLNAVRGRAQALVHRGELWCVAYAPDGRTLAVGGEDGTVRLHDATTKAERSILRGPTGRVRCLAIRPDGRQIAAGGADKRVWLWDLDRGGRARSLPGRRDAIRAIAYRPDGRLLAAGGADGTIRLWDPDSGVRLGVLEGGSTSLHGLAFHPDGRLAAGSADGIIRLWDTATGTATAELRGHLGEVRELAFCGDGRLLASGSDDETVRLWDAATGAALAVLPGHHQGVPGLAFHPDGRVLATGSADGSVRLWDVADAPGQPRILAGHRGPVRVLALSDDGTTLVTGGDDGVARVWEVATGTQRRALRGHQGPVSAVALAPEGGLVVTGGQDGTVRLWDLAGPSRSETLEARDGAIKALAFRPEDRTLVAVDKDGRTRFWDLAGRRMVRELPVDSIQVRTAAFDPAAALLYLGSPETAGPDQLWDLGSETATRRLGDNRGTSLCAAFSPDGRMLAVSGSNGFTELRDARTLAFLVALPSLQFAVASAAFSPDGRLLATGGRDGTIRLWDAAGARERWDAAGAPERGVLRGHRGPVRALAFAADGRRLFSAGDDGTARVWDAEDPESPGLRAHREALGLVRRHLASAASREDLRVRVRRDNLTRYDVKSRALDLVTTFWQARVNAEYEDLIQPLFDRGLTREEATRAFRERDDLPPARRKAALAQLKNWPESARALAARARAEAWRPGRPPEAYRTALDRASRARQLDPSNVAYRIAEGLALYRARGEAARGPLEALNRETRAAQVAALCALAMARAGAGDLAAAREALGLARAAIDAGEGQDTDENRALLLETEQVVELDPAFPADDPFAP